MKCSDVNFVGVNNLQNYNIEDMEIMFLCIVVFLFVLAVFDLSVGVSNDAVNFLNSAIGSKAASFKRILIVASVGVFIGDRKAHV